ncbi:endo alpha-1,4 polygalactosaminidase [Meiothermus granaticius]|uniref:Glycoside-hydrolase n=1 Tax=Meiothermus granaticius NBRC 107808 TaxID=1227551 RepID=A0A399F7U2_9DEIN|nr:endo alpha-1,4 polygalactosaminidase [Meiothermus granaticius]RIH91736.1 Glycoside-hydrolase [Meiothermus granaticius NBRC 107808]
MGNRKLLLPLALIAACTGQTQSGVTPPGSWWKPSPATPISWHWQLSQGFSVPRDLKPGVTVYDFDKDYMASADTVAKLKAAVPGAVAICYIDVGVYEDYRPDKGAFLEAQNQYRLDTGDSNAKLWGNKDAGWNGSYWLDVRQQKYLLPLMEARIKDCKDKGFDAVEPDESEVWDNNPGFPISMEQNHAYTRAIAELVHKYGMSVGLKGNNGEAALLEPYHDWALSEQCFEYGECQNLVNSFVKKGKAVFVVEYSVSPDCNYANQNHLNAARRDLNLVGPTASGYLYQPCRPDGSSAWP